MDSFIRFSSENIVGGLKGFEFVFAGPIFEKVFFLTFKIDKNKVEGIRH